MPDKAADCRFGLETKAGDKRKAEAKAPEPAKKQPSMVCIHFCVISQFSCSIGRVTIAHEHSIKMVRSSEHDTFVLLQAELEAELQKKKARAARFNVPVKTNADEVRS